LFRNNIWNYLNIFKIEKEIVLVDVESFVLTSHLEAFKKLVKWKTHGRTNCWVYGLLL